MIYKDDISRLCRNLQARKEVLSEELENLPDGEFYACVSGGKQRFYRRFPKKGNRKKERRVGIKKDPKLLNALVRKKYVVEALARLDKDIEEAGKLLTSYVPTDENSVMEDFVAKYPELTGGIYREVKNNGRHVILHGTDSRFHEENLISTATDGTARRSKGELLIGAKLDQYKIPYFYEALAHPDLPWIPDFKIIRPRDLKIFFWEHFGLVNDKKYMAHCRTKLEDYESVGIVPWDNLIITYDQADGGINERLIDALVHGWLL